MELVEKLQNVKPKKRTSALEGYHHSMGYAVMLLPFSTGHMLALRRFHESSISPYVSVWHCNPEGEWSIYNDGPSLETTCPRWWGPALIKAELTDIRLHWMDSNTLRVTMEKPSLEWTLSIKPSSGLLNLVNNVNTKIPYRFLRSGFMRRIQEVMARYVFNLGDLNFSFITPTQKDAMIVMEAFYYIDDSKAIWQGKDLGEQINLKRNPSIGNIALPRIPSFVTVHAFEKKRN